MIVGSVGRSPKVNETVKPAIVNKNENTIVIIIDVISDRNIVNEINAGKRPAHDKSRHSAMKGGGTKHLT